MWKNKRKIEHNSYKMKPMFDSIRKFLDEIDVYNSESLVKCEEKREYSPQSLVKSI